MKKKDIAPYYLVIGSTNWTGNFEREVIAYSMGVLDEVQMEINYAREELEAFYKEVFSENAPYEFWEGTNDVLDRFLLETYQEVDDWEQSTFYNVMGAPKELKEEVEGIDSIIYIQLQKPFDEYWSNIIIPRIKKYFADNKNMCGELLLLRTYDTQNKTPSIVCDHMVEFNDKTNELVTVEDVKRVNTELIKSVKELQDTIDDGRTMIAKEIIKKLMEIGVKPETIIQIANELS